MDQHNQNKALISRLRAALYDYDRDRLLSVMGEVFDDQAVIHLAHPFETLSGWQELADRALGGLAEAWPDLERRDTIVMAGQAQNGRSWVGTCGYYTGTFARPWLDIPPTGHQVAMRFHEYYCVEGGKIVEFQGLWDIPEVMMQAKAWPMAPSLGREWQVPGPATQDGLSIVPKKSTHTAASLALVEAMLVDLGRFAEHGIDGMRLEDHWHPKFSWYGPSGIGTSRGIKGFQQNHQIPFLKAMPNRLGDPAGGHFFGEGDYVGFTAWPGMSASLTGDGWLGIAPSGKAITMRSLDFWRCENGLIRENWVLVDLLHVWSQLGVDVLARMREFTKARQF